VVYAACVRQDTLPNVCAWLCASRPALPALLGLKWFVLFFGVMVCSTWHFCNAGVHFAADERGMLPVVDWTITALAHLCRAMAAAHDYTGLKKAFVIFAPDSPLLNVVQSLEAFHSCARDIARKHLTLFVTGLAAATSGVAAEDPLKNPDNVRLLADVLADRVLAGCPTDFERRNFLSLLGNAGFVQRGCFLQTACA
jgi:hypothetical protein